MNKKFIFGIDKIGKASYETHKLGELKFGGMDIDVVSFNSETSKDFKLQLQALINSQDEYSYDDLVKITSLHKRSLLFFDKSNGRLIGQFCCFDLNKLAIQKKNIMQPIFLIVHPDYRGQNLAKAFTLTIIEYNLTHPDNDVEIDYIQLSPYSKALETIFHIADWIGNPIYLCPSKNDLVDDRVYLKRTEFEKVMDSRKKELEMNLQLVDQSDRRFINTLGTN